MTLDECREHIRHGVTYISRADGIPESGVITSVNATFAFVRFAGDFTSKACRPEDLTLLVKGFGR